MATEPTQGKIAKADIQTFMLLSAWIVILGLVAAIAIGLVNPPGNISTQIFDLFLTATGGLITWVVQTKKER